MLEHPEARTKEDSSLIERRIPPAGDPFTAKAPHDEHKGDQDRPPCGCWDGWHWLGIAVEGPDIADGEEVVYERVRCRRCLGR